MWICRLVLVVLCEGWILSLVVCPALFAIEGCCDGFLRECVHGVGVVVLAGCSERGVKVVERVLVGA